MSSSDEVMLTPSLSSDITKQEASNGFEIALDEHDRDVVVVAVDGSKQSDDAFAWYFEHLHKKNNLVTLVHGLEIPAMPTRDSWDHQMQAGKKKRLELQEKYQEKFKEMGQVLGKFVSDFEKPGEFIVEVAKRENATYIVMGTRGLGKIRRTIMGSVSDYVVHHAHCPVVVSRS